MIETALSKLNELKRSGKITDLDYEELKIPIYLAQLERYISNVRILKEAEERMLQEIDNVDTKELVNIHKTIIKSVDSINSALNRFEPSLRDDVSIEDIKDKFNIDEEDNPSLILRKVISSQIVALLQNIYEIQENLKKYKIGSLNRWKSEESLKGISALVLDLAKTLAKLEGEEGADAELTMEEILEKYTKYANEEA